MNSDEAHRRAEALFKKEQQSREAQQATAEYDAEQRAVQEKTARLRALRLTRDAANQGGAAEPNTTRRAPNRACITLMCMAALRPVNSSRHAGQSPSAPRPAEISPLLRRVSRPERCCARGCFIADPQSPSPLICRQPLPASRPLSRR